MAQNSLHESFMYSLLNYSDPSHPITPSAIHTPDTLEFFSVLQSHIRNLRFDTPQTPKPLLIITPTHVSHVRAAVLAAQKHNLRMKIRSGGHDYEGVSYVSESPFLLLDMQNLRAIEIHMASETAWVQAGATIGELYYKISRKSKVHGFPAGVCPSVGVGGHLSGGGYGNMMRKYGLSVDNIVDAQVVDVRGRILDRNSMGEDLFWAIRGGGGASFCVVVAYKINLVPIPETVTVFRVDKTLEQKGTDDVVYRWQEVAPTLDEDLFIRMYLGVVKKKDQTEKTIRASFVGLFLGDSKKLMGLLYNSFPELGLKKSDCIVTSWVKSIFFWDDIPIGTPDDYLLVRKPKKLVHLKRKSDYLKEPIPKDGLRWIFQRLIELEFPMLAFNPYGGRMARIPATATPFPHRGNLAKIQYVLNWDEPGTEAENFYIGLLRKLYHYMTPFVSKNPRESYFNYKDHDLGINGHDDPRTSYEKGREYGIKYFKHNFK
ncbi:hypothetical protein TIFTF001_044950, partial [Ficus carica]